MSPLTTNTLFFGNLCDTDLQLEEIGVFQKEIEKLIIEENIKLQQLNVEYEQNPQLYNKKFHFEHTLTTNLRNSVIISLVIFLESELQNFCSALHKVLMLKVTYSEFKGSILDQFKTYIKLAGLEIDFESQIWQSLKEVVELRNCIVHYSGWLEDWHGRKFNRSNSIESLSKKFNSIQIDENKLVVLDKKACEDCILIIKNFIDMIYKCALLKLPK